MWRQYILTIQGNFCGGVFMSIALKEMVIITDGYITDLSAKWEQIIEIMRKRGIIISVISLLEEVNFNEDAIKINERLGEIRCDTSIKLLDKTLNRVVKESVKLTLKNVIDNSIKNISNNSLDKMHPYIKLQIINYVSDLSEYVDLKLVLLLVTSQEEANYVINNKRKIFRYLNKRKGKIKLYISYAKTLMASEMKKIILFFEEKDINDENILEI